MLRILIDMDDTINYFSHHFITNVLSTDHEFDFDYYKVSDWDIENYIIGCDDNQKLMDQILTNQKFWEEIPANMKAIRHISNLIVEHDVIFVSTPYTKKRNTCVKAKKEWLMSQFFPLITEKNIDKMTIFTKDKWNVPGDVIIDDNPEVLQKCWSLGSHITIKPVRSHNRNSPCIYDFKFWDSVPGIIEKIDKERGRPNDVKMMVEDVEINSVDMLRGL